PGNARQPAGANRRGADIPAAGLGGGGHGYSQRASVRAGEARCVPPAGRPGLLDDRRGAGPTGRAAGEPLSRGQARRDDLKRNEGPPPRAVTNTAHAAEGRFAQYMTSPWITRGAVLVGVGSTPL